MQGKSISNIGYDYDYEDEPIRRDTMKQQFEDDYNQNRQTSKNFFKFENLASSSKSLSTRTIVLALVITTIVVLIIVGGLAGLLYWIGRNSKLSLHSLRLFFIKIQKIFSS
jgi:hypothetical protein